MTFSRCPNCGTPLSLDHYCAIPDPVSRMSLEEILDTIKSSRVTISVHKLNYVSVYYCSDGIQLEMIELVCRQHNEDKIIGKFYEPSLSVLQRVYRVCMALGWIDTKLGD